MNYAVEDLEIINTTDGCILCDKNDNEIFILIPRKKAISARGENDLKKHLHLMKLLMKEDGVSRGEDTKGVAKKEVAIGLKPKRNGHGYVNSSIKRTNPIVWNTVCKYARQTEYISREFIKEGLLVGHNKAKEIIGWSSLESTQIFSALAVSRNYYSPAHVDTDFFFSALQVIVDTDEVSYNESSPIVHHFCFPTCGFAVAVRNGDVLLFNPSVFHCLSHKEKSFEGTDVFVNSFYLKTQVVGLHDNRIPFHHK